MPAVRDVYYAFTITPPPMPPDASLRRFAVSPPLLRMLMRRVMLLLRYALPLPMLACHYAATYACVHDAATPPLPAPLLAARRQRVRELRVKRARRAP